MPDSEHFAALANRLTIRRGLGRIVAVIEIVSPGNKHDNAAIRNFVRKSVDLIAKGVHFLVVDLFPPSQAIHTEFMT